MYEINLVPDIKAEAIKAQKIRNLIFFICGTVSVIAIGFVVLLVVIKVGQDFRLSSQDEKLELLSSKLAEFDGLEEILTIQSQLADLENIRNNKKVFSRIFAILAATVPSGRDKITLSNVDVDMGTGMLKLEGQAKAGAGTDGNNVRVLEAFSKQIGMMKYDYGRYVDEKGNEIPTMCIRETNENGETLRRENGDVYAIWTKGVEGCDPGAKGSKKATSKVDVDDVLVTKEESDEDEEENDESEVISDETETVEISRTPQFEEWYVSGHMLESGEITGVPHFDSQCFTYSLVDDGKGGKQPVETNNCMMALDTLTQNDMGEKKESYTFSNGRLEDGGELVLRFEGDITLNSEVLNFNNKHVIAVAPSGMNNVTDSYIQISSIFSEKAVDCEEGDVSCSSKE